MSNTGWKTITSTVIGALYVAGLLFNWWAQNTAAESFIVLFFGVGVGHKVVKRREAKRQYEADLKNSDLADLVRRNQRE